MATTSAIVIINEKMYLSVLKKYGEYWWFRFFLIGRKQLLGIQGGAGKFEKTS